MEYLIGLYFFLFGIIVGSFLNVVILRLPVNKDLIFTRSGCPQCGNQLKWFHNIPLLSFLFLKGKCAFCEDRISWRYPLIEMLTGLIALWLMPTHFSFESLSYFMYFFIIACIFICHFFIDLDHHLLLDSLNIYLLLVILPFTIFMHSWQFWLIGGLLGMGLPLFVTLAFYKIRGQIGLGGGDIKLYGILGLYLGPMGVVFNIFASCFVGAIVGILLIASKKISKDKPMAFGPAILIVASFQIFFPKLAEIVQMYLLG